MRPVTPCVPYYFRREAPIPDTLTIPDTLQGPSHPPPKCTQLLYRSCAPNQRARARSHETQPTRARARAHTHTQIAVAAVHPADGGGGPGAGRRRRRRLRRRPPLVRTRRPPGPPPAPPRAGHATRKPAGYRLARGGGGSVRFVAGAGAQSLPVAADTGRRARSTAPRDPPSPVRARALPVSKSAHAMAQAAFRVATGEQAPGQRATRTSAAGLLLSRCRGPGY